MIKSKVYSKRTDQELDYLYCDIRKMNIEEIETICNGLAVLTEKDCEKHGLTWNNNGLKEKLLLFFIGLYDEMKGLKQNE